MNRNILQDIKPLTSTGRNTKGTITELKSYDEERQVRPMSVNIEREERPSYSQPVETRRPVYHDDVPSTHKGSKKVLWIVTSIALVGLFVAVSFVFKGATVSVTPKSEHASINDTFVAKSGASDTELTFDVVEITEEVSAEIEATDTKEVSRKATGKITLSNSTTSSQPLKIETRLETKDGKIFKTDKAITVPAGKSVSGKVTPGQIEVAVTADAPGAEYNIGPSDFVIFGFKGTSKASLFKGTSKTAMTGGFKGTEANIKEEDRTALKEKLSQELKTSLTAKAIAQVPVDFIYYDDGVFFKPTDALLMSKVDGKTKATLSGTLSIILFNEGTFTRSLAKETLSQYDNEDITLQGLKAMKFTLKNKDTIVPKDAKDITFTLTGEADFVWSVDVDGLRDALVGKKKKEFNGILAGFSSVESAEVSLQPIWSSSFPDARKDISVKLVPIGVAATE